MRGYWSEGRHWLGAALARTDAVASAERAKALYAAGPLLYLVSDFAQARALLEESISIGRALVFRLALADALCELALLGEPCRQVALSRQARPSA